MEEKIKNFSSKNNYNYSETTEVPPHLVGYNIIKNYSVINKQSKEAIDIYKFTDSDNATNYFKNTHDEIINNLSDTDSYNIDNSDKINYSYIKAKLNDDRYFYLVNFNKLIYPQFNYLLYIIIPIAIIILIVISLLILKKRKAEKALI